MSIGCCGTSELFNPSCPPVALEPRDTFFAPAGRDTPEELRRQSVNVADIPLLTQALDAMPSMVMVLNHRRQIVAANEALRMVLNATTDQIAGKRLGEVVGCVRAKAGPDGCGTATHCVACGAVNAILDCQKGSDKVVRECRILVETPQGIAPMDLKATASNFQVGKDAFVVVAIEDISHSKRLNVLQRTFFHDLLNTAGCIQGYTSYLADERLGDQDVCERLTELSGDLIEAIQTQRDLVHAEAGDLQIEPEVLHTRAVLDKLRLQYLKHPAAAERVIRLGNIWEGIVASDPRLLLRVLGNMIKNALEATGPGGIVTLGCEQRGEDVVFSVHNAGVMPPEVQLQIFQRSFSTKGQPGRGIGTYSMKLLGERYLGGTVDFVSRTTEGTTFTLALPTQSITKS